MGRDSSLRLVKLLSPQVSIHAPAWGATRREYRPSIGCIVSIHAPAWGATLLWLCCSFSFFCFNPRARVGRDLYTIIVVLTRLDVSIHAPAWGATTMASTAMGGTPGFNPRARVGRDSTFDHCYSVTNVSIHAPAWGATHRLVYQGRCYLPFQSTRPRGARHTIYNI